MSKDTSVSTPDAAVQTESFELVITKEAKGYIEQAFLLQSDYEKYDDFIDQHLENALKARVDYLKARAIQQFDGVINKWLKSHPTASRNDAIVELCKSRANREMRDRAELAAKK